MAGVLGHNASQLLQNTQFNSFLQGQGRGVLNSPEFERLNPTVYDCMSLVLSEYKIHAVVA